jgi:MSHA biogenesis protein MshJ
MTISSNIQKANDSKNIESESVSAGIYKHTVVLRVSGSYFELLDFLQILESSQWHFYWEQLDYRVTNYPNADILLRVYTLGAEKGRIGV